MQKTHLRKHEHISRQVPSLDTHGPGEVIVCPLDLRSIKTVKKALSRISVDESYINSLARKFLFRTFLITNCDNKAANLLKQEMLSVGAEAAVSREVSSFKSGTSSVILGGTEKHFSQLISKLALQPFGLKNISGMLKNQWENTRQSTLECGGRRFDYGSKPLIMGILNMTPDSFYDGGEFFKIDNALKRAEEFIEDGVDIIDVGGESSRPGSDYVDADVEKRRVVKIIELLAKKGCAISVDTRRSSVAQAALDAGACMVNDISSLRDSSDMGEVVARAGAGIVLMHMKGNPKNMQAAPEYKDVVFEVRGFFKERIAYALTQGIKQNNIILDPGIGFGKLLDHNLLILKNIKSLLSLGYPVMIGVSRKSFIEMQMRPFLKEPLPPRERLPGSLAVTVSALYKGVRIFRVHDAAETRQALTIAENVEE